MLLMLFIRYRTIYWPQNCLDFASISFLTEVMAIQSRAQGPASFLAVKFFILVVKRPPDTTDIAQVTMARSEKPADGVYNLPIL